MSWQISHKCSGKICFSSSLFFFLSVHHQQRLQNPKIEKAEILDLAVDYLQKWTDKKGPSDG